MTAQIEENRVRTEPDPAAVADDLRRRVEGEVLFDTLHRTLVQARQLLDLAHAWIVAAFRQAYGVYALRMPLEHNANRMHTVDGFRAPHIP